MRVTVPRQHRPKVPVPPAGKFVGTIQGVNTDPWDAVLVDWSFEAQGQEWTLRQEMPTEDFGEMLLDLGFSDEVETDDLIGTKAGLDVHTRGGRKSAYVAAVAPLPPAPAEG